MKKLDRLWRGCALLCCFALAGAAQEPPRHSKKQWAALIGTIALNAAGTYADMRTSQAGARRGLRETSPIYASGADQGFHTRGVVAIWSITAGLAAGQVWAFRANSTVGQIGLDTVSGTLGIGHFIAAKHNRNLISK